MRLYLSSFDLGDRPEELVALAGSARRAAIIALDNRPEGRAVWLKEQTNKLVGLGFSVVELDLRSYFGVPHRYRDRRQGNLIGLSWFGASPARMKGCWRQRRASSPRADARPFGLRGLTPVSASNQGSPCDRRLDVAQQPTAIAGSNGLPVFRTPKHSTNSLRIAATTICLGLRRPWDFNRATSATIAGLYRIADIAGM